MAVEFMKWPKYQCFLFSRELKLIRSYTQAMDVNLTRSRDELEQRIDAATEGLNGDEAEAVHQEFSDEVFELRADFPRIYSTTSFVALFTLLEHQLDVLCRMRQQECNFSIAVHDLKDSGIEAAKNYLAKVCGIPFPTQTAEWQQIKNYQRLRNVIVHARGKLRTGKDNEVRKFLDAHKADTVDAWGDVSLSNKFCLEVIDVLESFMEQVTSAIPTKLTCHELSTPR